MFSVTTVARRCQASWPFATSDDSEGKQYERESVDGLGGPQLAINITSPIRRIIESGEGPASYDGVSPHI
jgi:hypothetical protein